jgi:mRNA-degrading endonuclease RelE of RelBE toxin-antitoxin system
MKLVYTDEYEKSIKKLKDKVAKERLSRLLEKLEKANSLKEISNVVSVANNPMIYRIKTGDYRLFVAYKDGEIKILLLEYKKNIL